MESERRLSWVKIVEHDERLGPERETFSPARTTVDHYYAGFIRACTGCCRVRDCRLGVRFRFPCRGLGSGPTPSCRSALVGLSPTVACFVAVLPEHRLRGLRYSVLTPTAMAASDSPRSLPTSATSVVFIKV